jgi:hypothetical protein
MPTTLHKWAGDELDVMTVAELVKVLGHFPPDTPVALLYEGQWNGLTMRRMEIGPDREGKAVLTFDADNFPQVAGLPEEG